ncbi:MAG: DUF6714 family protein [Myxococcota bacterium]
MGKRDRKRAAAAKPTHLQPLLDEIDCAFDGVPPPDADHRTLRQAEAWDGYVLVDQRRDHKGRWQDLSLQELLACPNALPHLDAQGIHYYLPAIMCADLRERGRLGWLSTSLRYTLQPRTGDLKRYQRQRFQPLTAPQRAAICGFVVHIDADVAVQDAWRRVVAAGDDRGWFRRFY